MTLKKLVPLLLLVLSAACAGEGEKRPAPPPVKRRTGSTPGVRAIPHNPRGAKLFPLRLDHVPIWVRLATSDKQRKRGLSGVASLAADEGMLFIYKRAARKSFWMKDCLISLDIAFLSGEGRVLKWRTLPPPSRTDPDAALPSVDSGVPVRFVLELSGGFFKRHGLDLGSKLTGLRDLPRNKVE